MQVTTPATVGPGRGVAGPTLTSTPRPVRRLPSTARDETRSERERFVTQDGMPAFEPRI